jgi:sporulation protein YlmC with PRC-barrel domain
MRKTFVMLAATAAMGLAAPAFAQDSNNGRQNREQARSNNQGQSNANRRAGQRANENSVHHDGMNHGDQDMQRQRRGNSQGAANANERARERANQNSAVREGMEVRDQRGRRVGQVREVKRAPDGTVIAIVVVLVVQINNTNVITLPAGSFTIINNVVVITNINLNIGS